MPSLPTGKEDVITVPDRDLVYDKTTSVSTHRQVGTNPDCVHQEKLLVPGNYRRLQREKRRRVDVSKEQINAAVLTMESTGRKPLSQPGSPPHRSCTQGPG